MQKVVRNRQIGFEHPMKSSTYSLSGGLFQHQLQLQVGHTQRPLVQVLQNSLTVLSIQTMHIHNVISRLRLDEL